MAKPISRLLKGLQTSANFSQAHWSAGYQDAVVAEIPPAKSNLWMFDIPNVEPFEGDLSIAIQQFFDAIGTIWVQMKSAKTSDRRQRMHAKIAQILAVAGKQFELPDEHNAWLSIMSLYVSSIQYKHNDLRKQNGLVLRSLAVAIVKKAHGFVHDSDGKLLTKDAIRSLVFKAVSKHCTHLLAHGKLNSADQIAQWEKKGLFVREGFSELEFPALDRLFEIYIDQHFEKTAHIFGAIDRE